MPADSTAPIVPTAPRHVSIVILAVLASVYFLSWAQDFLVPVLLGVVISYTLRPLVTGLVRLRIPRPLAVVLVMAGVASALGLGAYALRGQAQAIIDQVPETASKFAASLSRMRVSQIDNLKTLQDAATKVEKATALSAGASAAAHQPATHVVVDAPKFRLGDYLWKSSLGALGVLGQAATVAFLVFFLLLSGDTFKRKLVRLAGPSLSRQKVAVRILDEIGGSIQKYLLMLLTTNLLVALLTWIALRWIGLENAGAWAAAAGVLHIVPYLGPGVTAFATGVAAFMQFDSFATALLVAGATLGVAVVVGTFVTTWMTGRIALMNPAAVFIALLFWGWLWGVWGMLLSIPLIVIAKVVSQQLPPLQPLAELLGE